MIVPAFSRTELTRLPALSRIVVTVAPARSWTMLTVLPSRSRTVLTVVPAAVRTCVAVAVMPLVPISWALALPEPDALAEPVSPVVSERVGVLTVWFSVLSSWPVAEALAFA